ncbi:hypothetical protein A7K72_07415 [Candidatus Methylacidiphilum fumarolicum]|uniref:hypothetical protein n=1 Tax=Candidatus Methylacidiphilum fumarolicum TaxID=591154 RepID=UPI00106BD54C|nr:hypothetical protein [Candidatus Methylacidiphilum fumarolicum]TFE73031.1 hypothetical protein A7K72_07415 [Candidatus Methylacidiphilum fumarolicum]
MRKFSFFRLFLLLKNNHEPIGTQSWIPKFPLPIWSFLSAHPLIFLIPLGAFILLLAKTLDEGKILIRKTDPIEAYDSQYDQFYNEISHSNISPLTSKKPVPLPANGVDAFGLPVQGTFLTGSSTDNPKDSLADLASSIPIRGFQEGKEVIIGNRVFHPGDVFLLRTLNQLQKIKVLSIGSNALILQDQAGVEVRIPWPRVVMDENGVYGEIQIYNSLKR